MQPDVIGGARHGGLCDVDPLTGRCTTCSDAALPARVLALLPDGMADVELDGRCTNVAIDLVDDLAVGDLVLVHAGFAIARMQSG